MTETVVHRFDAAGQLKFAGIFRVNRSNRADIGVKHSETGRLHPV
jgi:hypothetical protein